MYDRADILGHPWRATTLPLAPDAFAPAPVATLIHHPVSGARSAMLQVHGFNDYVFHTELAQQVIDWGHCPAGLDLRRYGRSSQEGCPAFAVTAIDDYGEELDAAVAALRGQGIGRIWVNAHSTGGLAVARWLQTRQPTIDAVVLNAPFFAPPRLPAPGLVVPMLRSLGRAFPDVTVRGPTSPYTRSLHRACDAVPHGKGEWTFRTDWKRAHATPYTLGWFAAVSDAWDALRGDPPWTVPTLLLTSDRSLRSLRYGSDWHRADGVLDVDRIADVAREVASHLDHRRIEGAVHDVWLSSKPVRREAYRVTRAWLEEHDVVSS